MKRILFLLLVLSAAACSRPRIIPDEQLAAIFRDAYLTNAYVSREQIDTDSLKLYEPVFDRYGYTAEDVYYTIGNFSRRKSARLSDVVERAIVLLDTEGARYDHEVAVLDTIDRVARRTVTRTLRTDTLLREWAPGSVLEIDAPAAASWDGKAFVSRLRHDYFDSRSKIWMTKMLGGY